MSKMETFLDNICSLRRYFRLTIPIIIMMALFLGYSTLFVDFNDRWFPIYVIDVVLLVTFFVIFAGTYWFCTKREMGDD
jgi:hypothetical protein